MYTHIYSLYDQIAFAPDADDEYGNDDDDDDEYHDDVDEYDECC